MPTVVNTNTISMTAARLYGAAQTNASQSSERISTSLRVNSSFDDAAGISLMNGLGKTSLVMDQIIQNATDGISLVHVAEGAMEEVQTMITRLRELTIQAANDTMTAVDRQILKNEADQLIYEIDRIQAVTNWNGINLLDGTFTGQKIHVTPNGVQNDIDLSIENTDAATLFDDVQQFVNGDFSSSSYTTVTDGSGTYDSIDGWRIYKQQVDLGTTQIGGYTSPESPVYPGSSPGNDNTDTVNIASSGSWSIGNEGIQLNTGSMTITSFGVVHGPYLISENYIEIKGGSTVSFDWKAVSGGDDYDVYGYLLKDDGSTIQLLDSQGRTGGATYSQLVADADEGNYKFVFVAGTFDASGGTAAGASFKIDNVNVEKPSNQNTMIDYTDRTTIGETLARIDGASERLGNRRLYLGVQANRLENVVGNALMEAEKHKATEANGYGADYAKEVAELTKNQLLMKAVSAMIAQANISPKLATMLVKK
jgi:flagellin